MEGKGIQRSINSNTFLPKHLVEKGKNEELKTIRMSRQVTYKLTTNSAKAKNVRFSADIFWITFSILLNYLELYIKIL
jgi:hypothetical protein